MNLSVYGVGSLAAFLRAALFACAVLSSPALAVENLEAQRNQLQAARIASDRARASLKDLQTEQGRLSAALARSPLAQRLELQTQLDAVNAKIVKTGDRLSSVLDNILQLERVTGSAKESASNDLREQVQRAGMARRARSAYDSVQSGTRNWSAEPSAEALEAYHRSVLGPYYKSGFEFTRGQRVLVFDSTGRLIGYSFVSRLDGETLSLKQKWYRSAVDVLKGFAVPETSFVENYQAGTVVSHRGQHKIVTATYANGAIELDGMEVIDSQNLRAQATIVRQSRFGGCYDLFR